MRLLEMTRQEAEDAVDRELEANPALEGVEPAAASRDGEAMRERASADVPAYRLRINNSSPDTEVTARDIALMMASQSDSLYDHLRRQLDEHDMPDDVRAAADYIIGNLDSNGYLRRDVAAMADDMAFSTGVIVEPQVMDEALRQVRLLDPPGVGASGLQQALEMQLRAMRPSAERDNALRIVDEAFDALGMRHAHRIISTLKLGREEYEAAMELILSLNPRPGASFGSGDADHAGAVVPDFAVEEDDAGELHVSVPTRVPELAVEASFSAAVADMERNAAARRSAKNGGDMAFTQQLCRDARDFIEIWQRRQTTLMAVMTAIVKLQRRYFETSDDADLRPMALRDIAEMTGYDLSTISRATGGKYVATSWGVVPLRHLFSERMGHSAEAGGIGSARGIQAALRSMVEAEDKRHPLSDEELTRRLTSAGFEVKRRTVAKYREMMRIPPSRLRRRM